MRHENSSAINLSSGSSSMKGTVCWLLVMVVLWGLSWPATKLALNAVPPLWLGAIRFGSAGVCLFIFVALKKQLRLPAKSDLPIVLSIGILQMVVFTGLGMIAMQYTDTSHAVLLAYTTPLWGIVSSWLLLRHTPSAIQICALVIGLAGIGLICSPLEMDWSKPGVVMGCAFLITGAISWSLVIVHVRHHKWTATPLSLAPWQMLIATLPLIGIARLIDGSPQAIHLSKGLLGLLFFIGPIATSVCFVISSEYGRRISVFAMSNFTLGVPLIGALASIVLLGTSLSGLFLAGLALVFAGVSMTAFSSAKRQPG
ncbi:DMT family transporter [Rahnella bonaserana]|jgi:drug/metabolite transporter (DMT)-like permease|uniref:Threonine/homoserine exporter RhtA n=1 Tax=Rahnella bonaserana TaxID=2816248 RepID=A0ABS6LWY0_9GAMM|nr:EamA family transporter [Rahnella bonaserana]MBU9856603.1 EamA family transporter [Rahnella bonaserana]MCL9643822.1 DMT family transporter [Rahnella victoriana]WHZ42248.1 EamA family transporter [Rahnella bonaserana]